MDRLLTVKVIDTDCDYFGKVVTVVGLTGGIITVGGVRKPAIIYMCETDDGEKIMIDAERTAQLHCWTDPEAFADVKARAWEIASGTFTGKITPEDVKRLIEGEEEDPADWWKNAKGDIPDGI